MPSFKHQYFGGDTYSQHGEDLAIVALFHHMGVQRPSYIAIGAHHPWELSNTALLYKRGSRGICVEANPHLIDKFLRERPEDRTICAAVIGTAQPGDRVLLHRTGLTSGINSTMIENIARHVHMDTIAVDAVTLPQIVEWYMDGRWPDFITIDAEGRDLEILRTIDAQQASVVCVEALSQMGDITSEISEWCLANNFRIHSWHGGNVIIISGRLRDAAYGKQR